MSDSLSGSAQLSPVKRALLALEQAEAKLAASERAKSEPIAVIGMACRFPGGADDPEAFWQLLCEGLDAVTEVPRERWDAAALFHADPDEPGRAATRWGGFLQGIDRFDADFFGIAPREAESMDPQQRLLLEVTWHALERACLDPDRLAGSRTGVFLGLGSDDYRLVHGADLRRITAEFGTGTSLSAAAGRLSYVLGLQGPSLTVDTACSSSLVGIHLACQSLRNGESDLALAGGVNAILSPAGDVHVSKLRAAASDGRCKTFDAAADGYVRGEGCGIVVLKRLSDARRDGDPVLAVIRGSAVNQDGRSNGLTAPNGLAQQAVIRQALRNAGIAPGRVGYVETHGSGTPLGDPIEVRALAAVLGEAREPGRLAAIGSVKTNIGHLEAAAGVAGLIKTVQVLRHLRIPPSLHFRTPNPEIPFDRICLRVQQELGPWPEEGRPAVAGVSSFGFSGTNAHVVLEEAPAAEPSGPSRPWQLLLLSARTATALEAATDDLAAYLEGAGAPDLADVAHTSRVGRKRLSHRRALVCRDAREAVQALRSRDRDRLLSAVQEGRGRPVAFLFPGLGDQYPGMARGLYESEPSFRELVDRCAGLLLPELGLDVRDALFSDAAAAAPAGPGMDLRRLLGRGDGRAAADGPLLRTSIAQPAVFVVELALARLLMEWGLEPRALLGHSLGEYVAACLAGVFSLEDGLRLVAARARLIEESPAGAMLAVPWTEEELAPYLEGELSLAAVNAPAVCVAAGPAAEVAELEVRLAAQGVACRRLQTAHAFHSRCMEPLLDRFAELVRRVELHEPRLRYVSNVTGRWIEPREATDPWYWARHMRQTVRFAAGVAELLADPDLALVEVGPGQTLGSFVRQHPAVGAGRPVVSALRHEHTRDPDEAFLLGALGRLWLAGVDVDWGGFVKQERRRRVPLPAYPFERRRYWLDPPAEGAVQAPAAPARGKRPSVEDWFYEPVWEQAPRGGSVEPGRQTWLVFEERGVDGRGVGADLAARLAEAGHEVVRVTAGESFSEAADGSFRLHPGDREGYRVLVGRLVERGSAPGRVVHLWSAGGPAGSLDEELETGFYSVLWLAQALLARNAAGPVEIALVTRGVQAVTAEDVPRPGLAAALGPVLVLPQEVASFACRAIDLDPRDPDGAAGPLAAELLGRSHDPIVAFRGGERWVQGFAPAAPAGRGVPGPRAGCVCLITGGLGGIGLVLAEHLAREHGARLVLVGRSPFPAREEWEAWFESHGPDDPVSRKIRRLLGIEALGGEVLVLSADVADEARMREVVAEAERRFGGLHAVIHAAGVLSAEHFASVADLGAEQCEAHFRPKLRGLLVLEEVLRGRDLDIRLIFSSLSSVLGGLGFTAYAAANLTLDAFAQARSRAGAPWLSVGWDQWKVGEGMGFGPGATLTELEMTPEEGAAAFAHALTLGRGPHLINSTGDLRVRIDQWVRRLPRAEARQARSLYARPELGSAFVPGSNELERTIAQVWGDALGIERVGIDDNFFELGGNSLVGMQVISELGRRLGAQLSTMALFGAPTVRKLSQSLSPSLPGAEAPEPRPVPVAVPVLPASRDIAVIAMAGRFPGAQDVETLWANLTAGVESITFFSDEELEAAGIARADLDSPSYIKARAYLEGVELFDAPFFGYSPREAEFTDPQQRVFLECAWEALESAGYDSQRYRGSIGMFAGSSLSTYLLGFWGDPEVMEGRDGYQIVIGHDKDSLPTNTSYRLDLTGPSVAVQTHCSTSLVAVHMACQSLLTGESDMALAGGISIRFPQKFGYHFQPGGMESPDGHCRTFDARARGTVFGDGVAVVVLKRLADALADGDPIRAVIKGTAINNDGSLKVGYAAPSIEGQARAVAAALANAGVGAETIGYVEAHGTATELGDPIEVAALTQAFRATSGRTGYCAIGSVKTNFGHLDRAAGATSLIKAVLSLERGQIPATLHFEAPNPEIDFANSPFYVNARLSEWTANGEPRRAAVNSLGIGGTNAHVVLEEAPAPWPSGPSRPWQLLPLSARTATALEAATERLAAYLRSHPEAPIADVAFTLQVGRRAFQHRRAVLCQGIGDALESLATLDPRRVATHQLEPRTRPVVFLFPGLGDQYVGMSAGLYRSEPVFRDEVDRCAALLRPLLGRDVREVLCAEPAAGEAPSGGGTGPDLRRMLGRGAADGGSADAGADPLRSTSLAQPALFVVEYALARLWMSWGVRPHAMIGYSLGEYAAACLAGVLTLEDALSLVARRALLIEEVPAGAMLAVPLAEEEARALLSGPAGELSLAGINGPSLSVLSGTPAAVADLESRLLEQGIACRRVQTSHAFHSAMMEPIAERFAEIAAGVALAPPRIPYVSNVTGTWITPAEAMDPGYWVRHLCQPVRLDDGLRELLGDPDRVLLEVGPGQALSSLALQRRDGAAGDRTVLTSLRHRYDRQPDLAFLLNTLGQLWLAGVDIDWEAFRAGERRRRLPLPTYPFERRTYRIEARRPGAAAPAPASPEGRRELDDWFFVPVWKQSRPPAQLQARGNGHPETVLVLADETGLGERIARTLAAHGADAIVVRPGAGFQHLGEHLYTVAPASREDYEALLKHLRLLQRSPGRIVHAWSVTAPDGAATRLERMEAAQEAGFFSLFFLAQALGDQPGQGEIRIVVLSSQMQEVLGGELACPEKATLLGPCKVIPKEYPHLSCRSVDVVLPGPDGLDRLAGQIVRETLADSADEMVAYRGRQRWVCTWEPARLDPAGALDGLLREGGVYLVTGGLGGLGLAMAEHLGRSLRARLALVGRSPFPPREQWSGWLERHGPEDATAARIRRLLALEEAGAEVLVESADVSDLERMGEALARVRERWGRIHGVLHAAGVPGEGLIQTKSRETAAKVLAPKLAGTLVLERLLAGEEPELVVLFSSSAALTGGFGEVDYSAANLFLDAYAHYAAARGSTRVVSVDWAAWQWDAWQDSLLTAMPELQSRQREIRERYGIRFDEGEEVLRRVAAHAEGLPQVAVLPQGYEAMMAQWGRLTASDFLEEVDRALTQRPAHPRPNLRSAYAPPRTELERKIAEVWQEVLGIEPIGIDDQFFEMGGNSLIALQVLLKLEKRLGTKLPVTSLFEGPTVRELAPILSLQPGESSALEEAPSLVPVDRSGALPLSFSQHRHWFLHHFESDAAVLNELGVVELRGDIDVTAFGQSVGDAVRRHEVLRTTFPATADGQPVQVIAEASRINVPVIDLAGLGEHRAQSQLRQLLEAEARHAFDLARGPLLRCSLIRTGRDRHVAVVNMHHIVTDGVSMAIFKGELAESYAARIEGRPPALPELAIQYADFASWQRRWLQGEVLEGHLHYWRRQLAGATPTIDLPTDRPRPHRLDFRARRQPVFVPPQLTDRLRQLSREAGATLFTTVVASFLALLHSYSGQDDVTLGAPVANRDRPEVADLLGCFINALPLRVDMSGDPRFRELLARAKDTVLGALAHQDLPFEKLVEELNPERSRSHWPLFQVVLNFQNWLEAPILLSGGVELIRLEPLVPEKYDLQLYLREESDAMSGSLAYQTALFEPATIERMVDRLISLLEQVVADPDVRLSQLDLLSQAERKQRAMERIERDESNLKKLVATRRKAVKLSPSHVIETGYLSEDQKLPLVIKPAAPEVDLVSWAETHRDFIEAELLKHGGILFRGFPVPTAEVFEQFSRVVAPELLNYVEGSSPRIMVTDRVYTSTEYPPEYFVSMHNELSYAHRWPSKLLFFCLLEPRDGGATPIADSRRVLAELPESLRAKFAEKGVMYVRKLRRGKGAGLSWQTVFETEDTSFIESYCREGDIEFRWEADGSLRTRQIRPAVIRHPRTGELLWFNQADQFHPTNLGAEIAASLLAVTGEDDLPINAYFGDGSPLDPAELDEVRAAFRRSMVVFPWRQGDVLLLDNMLAAHGRMPFSGPRKVVVAMGSPVSLSEIACPKSATEPTESL